jgi:sulfotransferase
MATEKKICLISGMPRSGSTLLCNLLCQNPRFHATASSGILSILCLIRDTWDKVLEMQAMPDRKECEDIKRRVMREALMGYFGHVGREVMFDKSRGWLQSLELAAEVLGYRPKVLVPVRDLRDVLASFEKLYRKDHGIRAIRSEQDHYGAYLTVGGRCGVAMQADQPIGNSCAGITDAVARGWRESMLFVEFEELTARPARTMDGIYDFLGEPKFMHQFDDVVQVARENDDKHEYRNLHDIRPKVAPMAPQWPEVLGAVGNDYSENAYFWRRL